MSKLAVGLAVMATVVAGGAVWLQLASIDEIQVEIALLRGDVRRLGQMSPPQSSATVSSPAPRAEVALAAADRAELDRLRDEVAALKKSAEGFAKTTQLVQAAVAARTDSAKPVDLTPAKAWKNAGRATPQAAIETMIWAASGGDLDAVGKTVAFLPSARPKVDELFAQLTPETRAKYESPEKLFALMIAQDVSNVAGMQVLGQREVDGPDNVGMRVRFGNELGQTKDDSFLLHRGTDGAWRLMLSEATVDRFSRQVLNPTAKK